MGTTRKRRHSIFSISQSCAFSEQLGFLRQSLRRCNNKGFQNFKVAKKKKSSANFEIQLLQNVKTHDDGFCMKHAPLALPYLLHV